MSGGLRWLGGKAWWEVTRDERYFCAELLFLARQDLPAFVRFLNEEDKKQNKKTVKDAELMDIDANWEMAYEAVFYRDFWHAGLGDGKRHSRKRTFDLVLFSDRDILIIEAKAQQGFERKQLEEFKKDAEQVRKQAIRQEPECRVRLGALSSSKYTPRSETKDCFNGPYLTWKKLAALYGDDPKLQRADDLY